MPFAIYVLAALLILVLPISWLLAAAVAALIHELFHIGAVCLLGGRISGFRLGMGSARIEANLPGRGCALLAAAAGPAGSLLLLCCCRWVPKIAVCGAVQGVYNLLPFYPLDGGRILRYLLELLWPDSSETVASVVETSAAIVLLLAAVAGTMACSLGIWPVLVVLFPISGVLRRNIPCKEREMRVQ